MAGESLQVYDWQVEQVFSDVIIQPAESQHTKINADLSDARLQGGLGRVCDAVVKNGLRFTQQSNGSYSLDTVQRKFTPEPDLIPAWMAAAVWSNVPQEVPHHNPAFVSTTATTGIDEAKQKYVGYDNIKAVGRVFGLDVRSLRSSLIHALRWCPPNYTVGEPHAYSAYRYSYDLPETGIKLAALPMVARAMMKNPRVIYKSSHLTEHQAEEAAGIFMAFCEAVLTTPEEK